MQPILSDEEEKYEEEWLVIVQSKGEYTLSKMQSLILRQAMVGGERFVIFESFTIPINYIVEFYRVKRFLKDAKQLPDRAHEEVYKPIPKDKWDQMMKEARAKIGKR